MREIPLSQGLVAIVDDDDPKEPWRWKWFPEAAAIAYDEFQREAKEFARTNR